MAPAVPAELVAKMQRAEEHTMALLVENTDEYFQSAAYSIAIEPDDAAGLEHTVYIAFAEALPLGPTGKVNRRQIREAWRAGAYRDAAG